MNIDEILTPVEQGQLSRLSYIGRSVLSGEEQELVQSEDMPPYCVEANEKRILIRRAIENLPPRLRETFILHFYQELSYPEITQQQEISYQNVCKRISQARAILREELREYFIQEEGTDTELLVPAAATESKIGEMSKENAVVDKSGFIGSSN